jgi:hypothetical protein
MKKLFLVFALVCLIAPSAWALTMCYSWEDGQTILGNYPATGIVGTNVTSPVHTGLRSLELVRTATATTQAYVAWIRGLTAGDVVTCLVYMYDTTAGGNPSGRIWAHYGSSADVTLAKGSASGPADYSGVPVGWGPVPNSGTAYAWTFAPTDLTADALIVEIRSYGATAPLNVIYVDDITITAPDRAGVDIVFPGIGGPSANEETTWGGIKALYN